MRRPDVPVLVLLGLSALHHAVCLEALSSGSSLSGFRRAVRGAAQQQPPANLRGIDDDDYGAGLLTSACEAGEQTLGSGLALSANDVIMTVLPGSLPAMAVNLSPVSVASSTDCTAPVASLPSFITVRSRRGVPQQRGGLGPHTPQLARHSSTLISI